MDSPRRRLRLSLPLLLGTLAAAGSLTGCGDGQEVVAGVRAPSIQEAQEFVDEQIDEEPEAGWGKEQMLAQRSDRQQERATAREEEFEEASPPLAAEEGEEEVSLEPEGEEETEG